MLCSILERENENKTMGNNVEYDGGDNGATKEAQQHAYENVIKEKEKANMIEYDDNDNDNDTNNGHIENNRLITEEQAQQVHVIQNNDNTK